MRFKYKLLPFLISSALGGIAMPALSVPMQSATANWTINGVAGAGDSATSGIPGFVDILQNHSGPGGEVFYHTYGSVTPGSVFFGSRSSGSGKYDLTSPYKLDDFAYVVPGSGLVPVFFNFVLDNGELGIFCGACVGGGSAELAINIAVGNSSVASGNAKLTTTDDAGNTLLTHSGIASALFGTTASGTTANVLSNFNGVSYGWNATPVTQFLGNFLGGSTILIDYELTTRATGNFDSQVEQGYAGSWLCNPNDNLEVAAFAVEEGPGIFDGCNRQEIFSYQGNTIARAGDPFGAIPFGVGVTAGDIPEPGSLALLGAGLAAAAGIAGGRRRKRKPAA